MAKEFWTNSRLGGPSTFATGSSKAGGVGVGAVGDGAGSECSG